MEDWAAIAAEAAAAIADNGFTVTLYRPTGPRDTPWSVDRGSEPLPLIVIDGKPWRALAGGTEVTTGRSLLCGATGTIPTTGDLIRVRGRDHDVLNVRAVAPGGVDLLLYVELAS